MKYKLIVIIGIGLFFSLLSVNAQNEQKKISLSDIYRFYKFYPEGIENLRSMNDGEHYTVLEQYRRIEKYAYKDGKKISTVLNVNTLALKDLKYFEEYEFSPDETKILITANKKRLYRHSFVADFYIYDLNKPEIQPLSTNGQQQLATFSPDGSKIAFVRENNLFINDLATGSEKQITFDGEKNNIINGIPDWVYEEEFAFNKAYAWSPDSRKLAFYRFDESRVKLFKLTTYNELYPDWYEYKYPKAGEENSVVEIKVYDFESETTTSMNIAKDNDQYIPRIKWTKNPEILGIMRLNRLQNHLELLHANASTGESVVVFEEIEDEYISEPTDDMITYLDNGDEFILKSERDGWFHLYIYNFKTGSIRALTNGNYDVADLLGYDPGNSRIYYSSHEDSDTQLDVYSIGTDGKSKQKLTKGEGWNNSDFSTGFKYFVNEFSTINSAPLFTVHNTKGKQLRILEDNSELNERMKEYGFNKVELMQIPVYDTLSLNTFIIKPSDFDETKQYPLFMFVYGGPESQQVNDEYSNYFPWFQYLTQQGYVVACVDNRGTGGRGEDFRKSTYMQLGKLETIDQVESAIYLSKLPYINEDRIGIFGWSYGGYLSLSCLFKAADVFKMAISVAPVTNWRFYDTVYTERFLRTPQENPEGYDLNSPINFATQMKGKLLLVHGMADDNVHFQNSVELVKALNEADKQFDMQFYPNKNHGIYGGNTSYHLYQKMSSFILENL